MSRLDPPPPFNFASPHLWPIWRQRFLRYSTASKLNEEDAKVQVSTLVYSMGQEAESLISAIGGEDKTLEEILRKFDDFFETGNKMFKNRLRFFSRVQREGESLDDFCKALYDIAISAGFSDPEAMTRDRFITGLNNQAISLRAEAKGARSLHEILQDAKHFEFEIQRNREDSSRRKAENTNRLNTIRSRQGRCNPYYNGHSFPNVNCAESLRIISPGQGNINRFDSSDLRGYQGASMTSFTAPSFVCSRVCQDQHLGLTPENRRAVSSDEQLPLEVEFPMLANTSKIKLNTNEKSTKSTESEKDKSEKEERKRSSPKSA